MDRHRNSHPPTLYDVLAWPAVICSFAFALWLNVDSFDIDGEMLSILEGAIGALIAERALNRFGRGNNSS